MVGKQEAQIVEYTLTLKQLEGAKVNGPGPVAMRVWIDTKTQLPLKRVLSWEGGGDRHIFTETFTKFDINAKIDPKQFQLPKK